MSWFRLTLLVLCGHSPPAIAQDWPQILGPERNGHSPAHARLATHWPPTIEPVWQVELGSGFAGAAIVGERVYATHRIDDLEMLDACSARTGERLWRATWPARYRASVSPDNGPRCVPTVVDGRAICYGAAGDVVCIDLDQGDIAWQRPLRQEYDADDGYFGAGASPLVVGDLVVICLGGKDAGVVGLDLRSGETRWTATDYDASYAAPIAVDASTALVVTRLKTLLIRLTDGKVLAEVAFGSRGPTVNAATPIPLGSRRYLLTASYGVGASLLSVRPDDLQPLLQGSALLGSQYNTPVWTGTHVVGIDGREDVGRASLRAIDFDAQRVVWERPDFGPAHLVAVGDQLLCLGLEGDLTLLDGRSQQFKSLATTRLPGGTYRSLPALAGGRLVVRNSHATGGDSRLLCIELPVE